MTLSDKLFYWVFQNHPDRILELQPDLAQAPGGYRFSAPALKERERRLDGLFRPAQESAQQPVVILEAQMAADTAFLRRLIWRARCCSIRSRASTTGGWW